MSKPVNEAELNLTARQISLGLMKFAIIRSSTKEKQDAIDRLHELRLSVDELLEKIVPGYME